MWWQCSFDTSIDNFMMVPGFWKKGWVIRGGPHLHNCQEPHRTCEIEMNTYRKLTLRPSMEIEMNFYRKLTWRPSVVRQATPPAWAMLDAPLKLLQMMRPKSLATGNPSEKRSSLGTTVQPRRTPVNPAYLENDDVSIATCNKWLTVRIDVCYLMGESQDLI